MGNADPLMEEILHYWFGNGTDADLPDQARTKLWFGAEPSVDAYLRENFKTTLDDAIAGKLGHWQETPRGQLALIILFDQFSRSIFRDTAQAYAQDKLALALCEHGIENEYDQQISLIERVFYYLPMEHAENLTVQQQSVVAFRSLVDLSLPETKTIFQSFYEYALAHYNVIERFGRFPHRNMFLNRESTAAEEAYLSQMEHPF